MTVDQLTIIPLNFEDNSTLYIKLFLKDSKMNTSTYSANLIISYGNINKQAKFGKQHLYEMIQFHNDKLII